MSCITNFNPIETNNQSTALFSFACSLALNIYIKHLVKVTTTTKTMTVCTFNDKKYMQDLVKSVRRLCRMHTRKCKVGFT